MAQEPPDPQGPDGRALPASAGWNRRRRLAAAAAAALLVLAVVVTAVVLSLPKPEAAAPPPAAPPTTAPPTPTPTPTSAPTPTPPPDPAPTDLNILLIGSDSRVNARGEALAGNVSDQRGDVLVLLHLPADRQNIYGVSIMRDLWVDIPGYGGAKVNAGLELGGIPLQTKTVESLLSTHVDHTVMVDFEGFAALIDVLGGIDVEVTRPFTGTIESQHFYAPGPNRLNGALALDFVRERKAFADGDYQRVRNQQTFLKAVLAKASGSGVLADRTTVHTFVTGVLPHVSVSPGLTLETLERLAFSLRSVPAGNGVFFTLPTAGVGTSTDGQSIVLQNPAATAEVAAALGSGGLGNYVASHNLQNGN
ncbi:LytR family transcriptional regulator [Arthrobacter sp. UKPF54-2]|uniref:LCP family protein n=1 Tax=Arthrobacter sp. UKPF54-2 TaxID=2600159 RepID=UPI0011B1A798|nr:LCP family protein [Arthrobacter sp. UKPF54-2]QDY90224.1 LytR family transcriptional regulator [Arthrobacter sp. UKPF54-2]